MAKDVNDTNITADMYSTDEKTLIVDALKTHAEKVGRKAAAPAPRTIKELWQAELKRIEELARKVLK